MGLPLPPFDPNAQIPNNPFYAIAEYSISGPSGPLVIGDGLVVVDSTLTSPGGSETGTVTSVGTGAGLTGGPITTSGTIALDVSGATAGDYVFASLSVDTYGRITAITDGTVATETALGVVQLATASEVIAGADATKAITSCALTKKICDAVNLASSTNIASSAAVKTAYDAAAGAIQKGEILAKGDIIAGTGAGTVCRLALGNPGDSLHVGGTDPTGLVWCAAPVSTSIPCAIFTTQGQLLSSSAPGTPVAVACATADGKILTSNASCTSGVEWATNTSIPCSFLSTKGSLVAGGDGGLLCQISLGTTGHVLTADGANGVAWCANAALPCSLLSAKGALITRNESGEPTALLAPTVADKILVSCPTDPNGLAWVNQPPAAIPCSALSTKGQILVADENGCVTALSVGADGLVLKADSGCATGLTWDVDAGGPDIPCATITASGDILIGLANAVPTVLNVGADGYVLTPNSAVTGGLEWIANPSVPLVCFTNPGELLVGSGPASAIALPVGTNGQVLKACSTTPSGLIWETDEKGADIPCSLLTAAGDLIVATAANTPSALPIGTEGYVLKSVGGAPTWSADETGADIPCSLLTARGEIVVASGANTPFALSPGLDGQVLKACSSCPEGLVWQTDEKGADIPCSLLTGPGQIVASTGASAPYALPVGTDGQVLKACSTEASGLIWATDEQGADIPCSTLTATGDIIYASAANTPAALSPGTEGQVLKMVGGIPSWETDQQGDDIPCSVLTAAGDLLYASAANTPAVVPIGTEGFALKSIGGVPTWSASDVPFSCFTAKGDILVGTGSNTLCSFTVGGDGTVLKANSACPAGVEWTSDSGSPDATPVLRGILFGTSGTAGTDPVAVGYGALQVNGTGQGNTAVGWSALNKNTSGSRNTAVGAYALGCATQGIENSAFGFDSLKNLTTGAQNSAFGFGVLSSITCGSNNTAMGWCAMHSTTNGANNTAVGCGALKANDLGVSNIAVGSNTLTANTNGSFNVAIGDSALPANTTGNNNIAVGSCSLWSNTTGTNNTAVGVCALNNNTLGCQNNAFGSFALSKNTTGNFNLAVGECALVNNTNGSNNIAIGDNALETNGDDCFNVAIGSCTLKQATAGYNIAIGTNSGFSVTSGDHNIFLGGCGAGITDGIHNLVLGNTSNFPLPGCSCQIIIGTNNTTYLCLNQACAINIGSSGFGTAGQVLQSNGPTASPTWVAPGGVVEATTTTAGALIGCTSLSSRTSLGARAGGNGPDTVPHVAIGSNAGCCISSANVGGSVAIGSGAMQSHTAPGNEIAIGPSAMANATQTNGYNVAIGVGAAFSHGAGIGNVYVGMYAGEVNTGSANVMIGRHAGCHMTGGDDNIILTGGTCSGSDAVGPNSDGEIAFATRQNNASKWVRYDTNGSWISGSDARLKENINDLALGLDVVEQLKPRTYTWKANQVCSAGFVAQELDEVLSGVDPDNVLSIVSKKNPDIWGVAMGNMMPLVVKSIQELSDKINALEAENADLKARVTALGG